MSWAADVSALLAVVGALVLAFLGGRLRALLIASKKARALARVPGLVGPGPAARLRLEGRCIARLTSEESLPEQWSVASEVRWLGTLAPGDAAHGTLTWHRPDLLGPLADALLAYARHLELSALVKVGSAELAQSEVERARQVADLLRSEADFRVAASSTVAPPVVDLRPFGVDVLVGPRWAVHDASVATSQRQDFDEVGITDLGTDFGSFGPFPDVEPRWRGLDDATAGRLQKKAAAAARDLAARHPDSYNGVLPRLVAWRVETSSTSPVRRLHLLVERTTFLTWLVTNGDPEGDDDQGPTVPRELEHGANHVPVSIAVISADGYLLLPQRASDVAVYPDSFSSAANGNVELQARKGMRADLDGHGRVDVVGAALRECREELGSGLDLRRADLRVAALIRYSDRRETSAPVLLLRARSGLDLDDLVSGMRFADPVEGAFELGRQVVAVSASPDALGTAVPWLVAEHARGALTTPGLVASLLALAPAGSPELLQQALAQGAHRGPPPPTVVVRSRQP